MGKSDKLPEDDQARVGWAYEAAGDVARTEARFDAWADHYDGDVAAQFDWRGPEECMKAVRKYVSAQARILDAGAGTGLVGELLAEQGYGDLVAADLSIEMLRIAERKGVYREVCKADLTQPLGFPDAAFDAVLSIGTSGYVSGRVLAEFARVTAPGGCIIYTISDEHYAEGGYATEVAALVRTGIVQVVETGPVFAAIPRANADHMARVLRRRAGEAKDAAPLE